MRVIHPMLLAVFSMSACGPGKNDAAPVESAASAAEEPPAPTAPAEEPPSRAPPSPPSPPPQASPPPPPPSPRPPPRKAPDDQKQVVVLALSRGKGVPDSARHARDEARAWLQEQRDAKRVVSLEETRIGLEGERRICATFAREEDAAAAVQRLRDLGKGADLYSVELGTCERPPGEKP